MAVPHTLKMSRAVLSPNHRRGNGWKLAILPGPALWGSCSECCMGRQSPGCVWDPPAVVRHSELLCPGCAAAITGSRGGWGMKERVDELQLCPCRAPKLLLWAPGKARLMQAPAWAELPWGCPVLLALRSYNRHLVFWAGYCLAQQRANRAYFLGKGC